MSEQPPIGDIAVVPLADAEAAVHATVREIVAVIRENDSSPFLADLVARRFGGTGCVLPPAASPADEGLREALAFYADESTWKRGQTTGPFSHGDPMPAHVDLGERARAALAGVSAEATPDERMENPAARMLLPVDMPPPNPYQQAREVEQDALARMMSPSIREVTWNEGYAAGLAARDTNEPKEGDDA